MGAIIPLATILCVLSPSIDIAVSNPVLQNCHLLSPVSSALTNTKDSPVLLDFLEETELYRELANKALEKYKRENGDFAAFRVDRVERVVRAVSLCSRQLASEGPTPTWQVQTRWHWPSPLASHVQLLSN